MAVSFEFMLLFFSFSACVQIGRVFFFFLRINGSYRQIMGD